MNTLNRIGDIPCSLDFHCVFTLDMVHAYFWSWCCHLTEVLGFSVPKLLTMRYEKVIWVTHGMFWFHCSVYYLIRCSLYGLKWEADSYKLHYIQTYFFCIILWEYCENCSGLEIFRLPYLDRTESVTNSKVISEAKRIFLYNVYECFAFINF